MSELFFLSANPFSLWKGERYGRSRPNWWCMMTKSCFFWATPLFPYFLPPPVLEKDAPVSSLLSFWPGKNHRSPGEEGGGTGRRCQMGREIRDTCGRGGKRRRTRWDLPNMHLNSAMLSHNRIFFISLHEYCSRLRRFCFWVKAITERHHNSHFSPTYISCAWNSPPLTLFPLCRS